MADPMDESLPDKRRPDEVEEKKGEDSNKKLKLEIPSENNGICGFLTMAELEDDEDDEEDYGAEEYDSDVDGEGHSEEDAETVDTKGKEIVINEKGKEKLLVDSDSSDNSDSDGLELDDDLLDEIDLDNILPSKTRNRGPQTGLRISSNCDNKDTVLSLLYVLNGCKKPITLEIRDSPLVVARKEYGALRSIACASCETAVGKSGVKMPRQNLETE